MIAYHLSERNFLQFGNQLLQSRVCSFRQIQKRLFDPRFARFRGRKGRKTLVTFRKPIQYDGLLINDVFSTV